MKTKPVHHLSSIAQQYDVFVFDVYGVLHDGEDQIKTTFDAIQQLRAVGKTVFFLSNAPLRLLGVVEQLKKFGYDESCYHGLLSAGEQVYHALEHDIDRIQKEHGTRCYFIGTEAMTQIVPAGPITFTTTIDEADFILAAGPVHADDTVANYHAVLAQASSKSLPMVCANPDMQVFRKETMEIRAGSLAAHYERLGGVVYYYGKPHPATYVEAQVLLHNVPKKRILIIGDSLVTDMTGANDAHCDSLITVSRNTCFEIQVENAEFGFNEFCDRVGRLYNSHMVPTYFANPLTW